MKSTGICLVAAIGLVAGCGDGGSSTARVGPDGGDATASSSGSSSGSGGENCGADGATCCNGTACNTGLACNAAVVCVPSGAASSSGGSSSGSSGGIGGDGGADSGGDSSSDSGGDGSGGGDSAAASGPCRQGGYMGPFSGLYSSHLTILGTSVPISGQIAFVLAPEVAGALSIQNGAITGTADNVFPFFCSVTGALDCSAESLTGGWMQCIYCIGPLADGGMSCAMDGGGVGGGFAGILSASYDIDAGAFVHGTWNASEALAGNNGTMPGPDGGPPTSYLSDAGYGVIGAPYSFGGTGIWSAAHN